MRSHRPPGMTGANAAGIRLVLGCAATALLVTLVVIAPGQAASQGSKPGSKQAAAPAPPAVMVAPIAVEDVAPVYSFIGHVIAIQSVQVVARVTAFIEEIPVQQGSDVKSGAVLFQLQREQYQAAVQSAQANLNSAQAALALAEVSLKRSANLNQHGFEAQANLDQARATRDQAQANVLAGKANLAQAALNLSYCTIVSPIDGRIGAVSLTKGNLVTPTTPPLATINQIDPIRVEFAVSDRVIVRTQQRTGSTQNQIAAGLAFALRLPDGTQYKQAGKIAFLSNQVDSATGTVSVYADFPNPNGLLLPGAYENVEVRRAKPDRRPVVPVQAVQTDQNGSYVLLVAADNKVSQQQITVGRQIAQDFIVEKGLGGGEQVIVEGVQKVRPGEVVNPTEAPAPPQASAEGPAEEASRGG